MTFALFFANTTINSAFRVVVTDVSRARSIVGVISAIVLVLGVFGAIYLREWYLRRGFDRLRQLGRDDSAGSAAIQGKRQPLVKGARRGPRPAVVVQRPIVARSATATGPLWVTNTQSGAPAMPGEPNTGTMQVVAEDEYYEIYVDGAFCGNSPATLRLPQGEHCIEVKREGWQDYRREVFLAGGANLNLRPVLERQEEKAEEA